MKSSESKEYLTFDYRAIRLMIGLIAIFFPLVVRIFASKITDSISWAYHTNARDVYVGFLFVISLVATALTTFMLSAAGALVPGD